MSENENLPLLSKTSSSNDYITAERSPGYLLISVPQTKEKLVVKNLERLGNCSGTIVAISATILVILLILGISSRADVLEITRGHGVQRASEPISQTAPGDIVETPLGSVKGYIRKSRKGRDYLAYYKVPYAKAPLGNLRFKDPHPVDPWTGVRDYSQVAPSCIQKSKHVAENITIGEEDCLYSNIYVPLVSNEAEESQSFPVMVYIHGGGFGDGNGSRYGGEYLMDEDVVLVVFQFRLGLLGFLNTGDREATGNMAFKDQVMLLKWVKEYIQYFKGDPTKITVFGNSSGGFAVSFLMISPMARGLFHRAISQSGTMLCRSDNILDLQPEVTKKAAAEAFNCPQETSAELLDCLRTVNATDLALINSPNVNYALTVEKGFDSNDLSDVFMPDKPYELLKAGKALIAGIASTEWIGMSLGLLSNNNVINSLNANFSLYAPAILGMDLTSEESQQIKSFYFNGEPIGIQTERNLTNLLSDIRTAHATKVTADFHSLASDTYLYYITKRPAKSYADKVLAWVDLPPESIKTAVSHADELQFLFPYLGYPEYPVSDTEYFPFSQRFVKLWTRFAATGKPIINGELENWNPIKRPSSTSPVATDSMKYYWYELGDETGPTVVLNERMRFWDQFSHKQMKYDQ